MIDTIALTFPQRSFEILDHKRFTPSTKNFFVPPYLEFGRNPFIKAVYNPTTVDKKQFGYLPRLTVMKAVRRSHFEISLKVEFSAPKLLYGNNFDEIDEHEFGEICRRLQKILEYMGVRIIDLSLIADAAVSAVHYGKNIILTDYMTPYAILNEVAKVNVNRALDMSRTDFRNEGHAVKYHSNDYEVIFYDKLKDLEQSKKSEKRSVEKDNHTQLSIFDDIKMRQPFQVLRMEVRLGNRKKIKATVQKFGYKVDLTFVELFSKDLAKKILIDTMKKIEASYPILLYADVNSNEELLVTLMLNNPKLSYKQLLTFMGAYQLLKELGTRRFRQIMGKFSNTSWYRFNKEMNALNLGKKENVFDFMLSELNTFEKVYLSKYKDNI